jgi:archaellum component FlaF (FlaF/FlaG flagellin family)
MSCTATKTTTSAEIPKADDTKTFLADEDGCPDLVLSSLEIVEQKKSKVYIEYTLTNNGINPVSLMGKDPKNDQDNVAVKIYFSSDETYQRGDILMGGDYVSNDFLKTNEGELKPGESYTTTVKISTKTKTSFTPYIVFDADAWQIVRECDETNNQKAILVD